MNSLNITGRLTKDPEQRFTSTNNVAVTSFTIAHDDGFGDGKKTYFFSCTAWKKTAENIAKFFKKGDSIAISGRLTQRSWENNEGKKVSVTEITVETFDFMGGKKEGTNNLQSEGQKDGFYPLDEDDELPFK